MPPISLRKEHISSFSAEVSHRFIPDPNRIRDDTPLCGAEFKRAELNWDVFGEGGGRPGAVIFLK